MTHRGDLLRSVEAQLLALVALPGHAVRVSALDGPRHLFRAVAALVEDGDPEPVVGLDGDGDVQCQWDLGDAVLTLVVDDRGNGWAWAHDTDGVEALYAEWGQADECPVAWTGAAQVLRRARNRQACA